MSTQVVFTGTAKNDLWEIAVHLAKRSGSRELAVRFVRELQGRRRSWRSSRNPAHSRRTGC